MHQTKSYWVLLAAFGVTTAFVGAACTVNGTSTVDTNAGAAGEDTAGTTSAGAAGAGEGGASAGTGGASGGTAGATGGTGGIDPTTVPACDSGDTPTGTPLTSCTFGVTDDCSTCVRTHCCSEFEECFGTNPGNVCGYGGPNNGGEFPCYQDCLQTVFKTNRSISDDDRATCANNCATSKDSMGALDCSTIGTSTNSLIACLMENGCNTDCYGG